LVGVDTDNCWSSRASVADIDVDVGAAMIGLFIVIVPCVVPVIIITGVSAGDNGLAPSASDSLARVEKLREEDGVLFPTSTDCGVATMLSKECCCVLLMFGLMAGFTSVPANAKSLWIRFADGYEDVAASTEDITAAANCPLTICTLAAGQSGCARLLLPSWFQDCCLSSSIQVEQRGWMVSQEESGVGSAAEEVGGGEGTHLGLVSNRGNPRVFFLYPYPTPPNTLPLREGKGYPSDEWRVR
jgi:hypothetical protein